jgi:hypothetical protein
MVSYLRESMAVLENFGFLNVFLPFVFVFLVLYAVLEKTRVLGAEKDKPKRNLNAMVAFVVSFVFIASVSRVESIIKYLEILGMMLVFVASILFMFSAFQQNAFFEKKNYLYSLALVFVIVAFFYVSGLINKVKYSFIFELLFNPVVVIVVVFYVLVMIITHDSDASKSDEAVKALEKEGFKNLGEKKV